MAGVFWFHGRLHRNRSFKLVFFVSVSAMWEHVEQVFEKGNSQATYYFSDTSISPEIHFLCQTFPTQVLQINQLYGFQIHKFSCVFFFFIFVQSESYFLMLSFHHMAHYIFENKIAPRKLSCQLSEMQRYAGHYFIIYKKKKSSKFSRLGS